MKKKKSNQKNIIIIYLKFYFAFIYMNTDITNIDIIVINENKKCK